MKQAIPDAVLEQHLGILGKTGRGKSTTGKVCVEQVHDQGFRVCILDTLKSDWWGITSSADGRRPGLPFHILGGPHAHLPLTSSAGKTIADLVARGQLRHTIIDMAEFEPGGQMKFFAEFAPRLMSRMKGVLYLVIEEVHILAPKERAGMGHENMSIHWAKVLATAGRSKGVRLIVLSQRTQAVHNAVLGSLDSMIVHGMTAPADMDPVVKWLKANNKDKARNAEIENSLSDLLPGQAWLCSSQARLFERVQMPRARTYDNTKAPTDDEELREVKTAPVDLEQLRALLGKAAEEAEASDPGVLRKRIKELEGQLAREVRNIPITAEEIDGHRKQGFDQGYPAGYQAGHDDGFGAALQPLRFAAQKLWDEQRHQAEVMQESFLKVLDDAKPPMIPERKPPKQYPAPTASLPGNPLLDKAGRKELFTKIANDINTEYRETLDATAAPAGLKLKILGALRWLEDKDIEPAPRQMVGALADFVPDKGYGARMLGQLKTDGLVTYPVPGFVKLTSEGRILAPEPPSYATVYDAWEAMVSGLHRDVLRYLNSVHPAAVSREFLSKHLEKQFDKGYGARVLGELKTMGAIRYPNPGTLQLTRYVMPDVP